MQISEITRNGHTVQRAERISASSKETLTMISFTHLNSAIDNERHATNEHNELMLHILAGLQIPGRQIARPTKAFARRRSHLLLCFEKSSTRLDELLMANQHGRSVAHRSTHAPTHYGNIARR